MLISIVNDKMHVFSRKYTIAVAMACRVIGEWHQSIEGDVVFAEFWPLRVWNVSGVSLVRHRFNLVSTNLFMFQSEVVRHVTGNR